jgi:hypothetical protein
MRDKFAAEGDAEVSFHIGIVGYADRKFDTERALCILNKIFAEIKRGYGGKEVVIVSGATMCGIHKLLYPMATGLGYRTEGVMCSKGYEWDLYPVDELFVVGDSWGEESDFFTDRIDVLYRIGGGKQSLKECQLAKSKGKKTIEYELEELV